MHRHIRGVVEAPAEDFRPCSPVWCRWEEGGAPFGSEEEGGGTEGDLEQSGMNSWEGDQERLAGSSAAGWSERNWEEEAGEEGKLSSYQVP